MNYIRGHCYKLLSTRNDSLQQKKCNLLSCLATMLTTKPNSTPPTSITTISFAIIMKNPRFFPMSHTH